MTISATTPTITPIITACELICGKPDDAVVVDVVVSILKMFSRLNFTIKSPSLNLIIIIIYCKKTLDK